MPCNSDYLNPTHREAELQLAARILVYVLNETGGKPSSELKAAANDYYCKDDYIPTLCDTVRRLTEEQRERIMYDGRNPKARALATWWEKHEQADEERANREARDAQNKAIRAAVHARMTPEERRAFGLPEADTEGL